MPPAVGAVVSAVLSSNVQTPAVIVGSTLYFVHSLAPDAAVLINTSTLFASSLLSNAVPETVMVLFTVAFAAGVLILTVGGVLSSCSVKSGKSAVFPALSVRRTVTAPSASCAFGIVAVYVPPLSVGTIAGDSNVFPILTTLISAGFKPLPPEASLAVNVKVTSFVPFTSFAVTPLCPSTVPSVHMSGEAVSICTVCIDSI